MDHANNQRLIELVAESASASLQTPFPFITTRESNLQLLELAKMRRVQRTVTDAERVIAAGPRMPAPDDGIPANLPPAAVAAIRAERARCHHMVEEIRATARTQIRRVSDAWGGLVEALHSQAQQVAEASDTKLGPIS